MRVNKILLALVGAGVLMISLNQVVKAVSPAPPLSLPLDNVFTVPKGANSSVDKNVTIITEDIKSQVGSIFSTEGNKLDLTQSFHAEMYVYLGDKRETAADGMTFVMHADKARAANFTGGRGSQLGVYAVQGSGGVDGLKEQIERSFVIEFDTYHNGDFNGDKMDIEVDKNENKGHIAYAFPELLSSYNLKDDKVVSLKHQGLYYPTDYLSNGKWHLFSVNWDAEKRIFAYDFDDAPTVSVPINPSTIFGTNSVYWGFTGSTGGFSQESKVAFKQIPGLVNVTSNMKITKDGKDITDTGVSGTEGDIKIQYDLKYNDGKQDMLRPVFNLDVSDFLSFTPGTLTVNGVVVSDDNFVDGKLSYSLPTNLNKIEDTLTILFEGTPKIVTDKDIKANLNYSITADNYFGNNMKSTFPIKKVDIVTRADFENQSWLINEINHQLAPKKLDIDVYEVDLAKITSIDNTNTSGAVYPTEYIPASITKLPNLATLKIENLNLVGRLPAELADLIKLKNLSISGNNFVGGIPSSFGKMSQIESLNLNNNNLKGTVPLSLGLLPNLKKINLHDNPLSGQLPDFPMSMEQITLNNTQITYNLATIPSFLEKIEGNTYSNTFIAGLKLSGNVEVNSKNAQIKPFNKSDSGYFNLKVTQEDTTQDLYDEHIYTIKNTVDGTVYYKGKKDIEATIPYKKDISYTVILDDAEKNPNNVCIVLGKKRELKFQEIPVFLSLKIKLGAEKKAVMKEGNVLIFDDRENSKWKLSITPSELTQGERKLHGEYIYTNKLGVSYSILNGQKFLLETGESDSVNEVIPISDTWDNKYGLSYKAYRSNIIGEYQGDVTWTLEDAP